MTRVCECGRPLVSDNDLIRGSCFRCHIGTVRFDKGHLVNRLHPGATMKESQDIIKADARANGWDPVPTSEWG
jgi:hypothetical protein